jgi:hypothetical protein
MLLGKHHAEPNLADQAPLTGVIISFDSKFEINFDSFNLCAGKL